jgi:peptidoglycan/xylan/chitin deacetylase (PgdA/CDA1 family)
MLRPLFRMLSPAGARARLSTLIFHRVSPAPDPLFPGEMDAKRFEAVCSWLAGWFNVLPLDEAAERLCAGTLPERAAAITFDDGYADNHDVALPILRCHGLPATFFIATGYLDGGRMWNDTVIEAVRRTAHAELDAEACGVDGLGSVDVRTLADKQVAIARLLDAIKYLEPARREVVVSAIARAAGAALPRDLMLSTAQLRGLHRAGMQVGAHTVSHPILARLDADAVRAEIADGKRCLENLLDAPVPVFAYPNGKPGVDYGDAAVQVVRSLGFAAAVSTRSGSATRSNDVFQLPRFTPWDTTRWRYGLRLLANLRPA